MILSFPFIRSSEICLVSFEGMEYKMRSSSQTRVGQAGGTMDGEAWRVGVVKAPKPLRETLEPPKLSRFAVCDDFE